jgi:hypothetical protein
MSTTGGFFSLPKTQALANADLSKEVESHFLNITAGPALSVLINPSQNYKGFTAYNVSSNYLRCVVSLAVGIISTTGGAERYCIIPPGGTYSLDLGSDAESANAAGSISPIDTLQFQTIVAPQTSGAFSASALSVTAATAGAIVVNFVTS